MDLIYTDANRVDQGVIRTTSFDMSYGAKENDFETTLGADEPVLDYGAYIYIEGTEYGGVVDGKSTTSNADSITYRGRTWHGVLNSKVIQPDSGADYLIVSGDVHDVLSMLIDRLGLTGLFTVSGSPSEITVKNYKFHRYCKAYDGIRAMLDEVGAKLKFAWLNRSVCLSVELIVDYSDSPADGDTAVLAVERCEKKVNHLICLGRGELAAREVIHLYVDNFGKVGKTQYYTGLDEITDVYENAVVESLESLETNGKNRLRELRNTDKAEISMEETEKIFDIGDIVGATEIKSGISATATVSQKIVKIVNGTVSTQYQTGG